ncbi:inositol phosphosphingolipid phospholipase C [Diaporthe helianthi]|uniref:Inositol phosphosphingolipid phospholipase C n=1 Tax=Diaporthe helianthi TaxID=158607 RepID=A0A2P5IEB6_DIAHE|nr:inositol phosphosphingolipid phospholipase C [Diaporthe helianthi]
MQHHAHPHSQPPDVNITTLNCWGLKFNISKLRQPRLREIGRQIAGASPAPDILCLQEVWAHDDYLAIRRETAAILPHGKFYHSGAFGGGLAILSRWPIDESSMVPYVLNGRPTAFWRGDWYVGKGVACARLRYGPWPDDLIDVFNTHTHAPYDTDRGDSYRVHRESQAWQLAKLLRAAAESGHLVIAAGDFNMTPMSPAHRIITGRAPVRDAWRVLHPHSSLGCSHDAAEKARRRPVPTAEFNLVENGVTSNSVFNTWRWAPSEQKKLGRGRPIIGVDPARPDPRAKRLDYVFASTGPRELDGGRVGGWVVSDARVGMTARHPDLGCSLSDHFSVEVTLSFHTTSRDAAEAASLKWPLPPGATSSLSAFRTSNLPAHHHHHHHHSGLDNITNTTTDKDPADQPQGVSPGAVDGGSPADGAFLQLQTPTPSSTRTSFIQRPRSRQSTSPSSAAAAAAAADHDTQLLSSLGPSPPGAGGHDDGPSSPLLLSSPSPFGQRGEDFDSLLAGLESYQAREAAQAFHRALHFGSWVLVTVACYVAVWFVPTHGAGLTRSQNHAVNFVLLLLSSLGLVAGCIDGLMALLFFRGSEKRALKEYEWELRNARALAAGDGHGVVEETGGFKS